MRERVIRAAAYRPFEGDKRVFVVEAAEAMRDESQNALLKTLEEPPTFVHLILLSSEPGALLETVASRCQPVEFASLPPEAVEAALAADGPISGDIGGKSSRRQAEAGPEEIAAAARLSAGDLDRARLLLSDSGRSLRAAALELGGAVGVDSPDTQRASASAEAMPTAHPAWRQLLDAAESAGEDADAETREVLEEEAKAGVKRTARDIADEAKRAARRRRTEILDLGLELTAAWFRDLAAVASAAPEVAYNRDRLPALQAQAAALDPARPRRAAELVQDTRRRLDLNVSEELALEALFYRLERLLGND